MHSDIAIKASPFTLPAAPFSGLPRFAGGMARAACERLLALPVLAALYERAETGPAAVPFAERALEVLEVTVSVLADDVRRIPRDGPVIVVANHPFGGLDGLVLTALLQRVRPDVRLLANHLLARIPEMRETCIFVDPFGGPGAAARNRPGMAAAVRWLSRGGALGVFPAGEVAHFCMRRRCVTDPPWSDAVVRLALRTRATVQPVFFDGRNTRLFQLGGMLHPRVRTALLPRELLAARGRSVQVAIGTPIPFERLSRQVSTGAGASRRDGPAALTEYLRVRTYILKGRSAAAAPRPKLGQAATPVIEPVPPSALAAEIDALPPDRLLCAGGSLRVLHAGAGEIPMVLREIGRLRERTFRLVGEGTGREIDLDRFDEHYLHLFLWDAEARRLAGAYRMGLTDVLLDRFGPAGLYTSTLFAYRPRLLRQLNPALELGRSFVVPEYQRDYAPLMLLWKGIGRYVAQHPRYRRLFGAVSVSDEFQSMTRQLLMAFLKAHSFDGALAALVRPRNPPKRSRFRDVDERRLATLVHDVADVEELVGEIECNRRGVPVLLRQYLKLNAKLLGFNIDPDFGDVLDGLVCVDLTAVGRPILNRYLGREGAEAFLAFHAGK